MSLSTRATTAKEGIELFQFGLNCIRRQAQNGDFYFHEHPGRAASWNQQALENIPGPRYIAEFDMCMMGSVLSM